MPDLASINPEAGYHAIPQDPLEIALALRAGQVAWEQFPYLALRFGERGQRFTHSDSCWLVALCRMEPAASTRNLEWLRGLLSTRGIPTVILEAHLAAICTELALVHPQHPGRPARYAPFLAARAAERDALLRAAAQVPRLDAYEARLQACPGMTVPAAALLVASAWLDECAGATGALASMLPWMRDPLRFGSDWISTIDELAASLGPTGREPC